MLKRTTHEESNVIRSRDNFLFNSKFCRMIAYTQYVVCMNVNEKSFSREEMRKEKKRKWILHSRVAYIFIEKNNAAIAVVLHTSKVGKYDYL